MRFAPLEPLGNEFKRCYYRRSRRCGRDETGASGLFDKAAACGRDCDSGLFDKAACATWCTTAGIGKRRFLTRQRHVDLTGTWGLLTRRSVRLGSQQRESKGPHSRSEDHTSAPGRTWAPTRHPRPTHMSEVRTTRAHAAPTPDPHERTPDPHERRHTPGGPHEKPNTHTGERFFKKAHMDV